MISKINSKIIETVSENGWGDIFQSFFDTSDGKRLLLFLKELLLDKDRVVYPSLDNVFKIFKDLHIDDVRVIILGQDPYHGQNQATGYAFAVNNFTIRPPSLRNIFKSIKIDTGEEIDQRNSDLTGWVSQGIMLLNSILTVERGCPLSHQGKGWEQFTSHVISSILKKKHNTVVMLWGKTSNDVLAGTENLSIKHLILESDHPSYANLRDNFFKCQHFSKCNKYLKETSGKEINWGYVSVNGFEKPSIFEYFESHQENKNVTQTEDQAG